MTSLEIPSTSLLVSNQLVSQEELMFLLLLIILLKMKSPVLIEERSTPKVKESWICILWMEYRNERKFESLALIVQSFGFRPLSS